MTASEPRYAAGPAASAPPRRRRSPHASAPERVNVDGWIAAAFLVACFVLGGSSRFYLLPHLSVRLLSIAAIAWALWRMGTDDRRVARPFALSVLALGALMAAQLVPLPPALWAALPGRGFYAEAVASVGLGDVWRPVTLTPDLTVNSLLALLPPLAAALLFGPLQAPDRKLVFEVLLGCVAVGVLLGGLQLVTAGYYPYPYDNRGTAVGFFANRNHQAVFLAIGIVMVLARWRMAKRRDLASPRTVAAAGAVFVLLPLLALTGSRTGLAAGAIAFAGAGLVFGGDLLRRQAGPRRAAILGGGAALLAAAVGLTFFSTREGAVTRILETGGTIGTTELRIAHLPAMMEMAWTFFPIGSGFGSFDAVFRRFEADALLQPPFFNHAHSEPVHLLIEGGLPVLVLFGIGMVWLVRRASLLIPRKSTSTDLAMAQVGVMGLILLAFGSIVDYPVRTPFLGVVAILLAVWAADRPAAPGRRPDLAG